MTGGVANNGVHSGPAVVPLLIGVTGHRQIPEGLREPIANAVRQVFTELRRTYPATPLALLSPLGAGADQLVADAALDAQTSSPVQLIAVLPWSRELDASIGTPEGERGRCTRLIDRAQSIVEMPLAPGVDAERVRLDSALRGAQYEQVGRYIARHVQILIAVWDGDTSRDSHSARMVRAHAEGAPAPFTARVGVLDAPELAAVCQLSTQPAPNAMALVPQWTWPAVDEISPVRQIPEGWWRQTWWWVRTALLACHRLRHGNHQGLPGETPEGERLLRQRWSSIDRFNADVQRFSADEGFAVLLEQSVNNLVPEPIAATLPPPLQSLRQHYGLADALAVRWQKSTWRSIDAMFAIAFLAIATLELYAHRLHDVFWLLAAYLALLSCGYAVFRWTRRVGQQGRWLDSRALAEALRVQFFWRWAGLTDCVADHYLRHFRGELDWIRHAVRAAYLVAGGHSEHPADGLFGQQARLQAALTHWVTAQRSFFARGAPANSEMEISFATAARLMFIGAVATTALHLWYHADMHHMNHDLVLTTFGCLVVAAFLEEYSEVHAYALLARRYRWMTSLYAAAESRLQSLIDRADFSASQADDGRQLLFELGREALAENADWVIQHRERPPELPAG